jgi:hypothetical protein
MNGSSVAAAAVPRWVVNVPLSMRVERMGRHLPEECSRSHRRRYRPRCRVGSAHAAQSSNVDIIHREVQISGSVTKQAAEE